ncbi:hypothetical protein [Cystobacter ferrugineus]|uniref:Uncharacterized protein n=1 Tax=Cystobacter ferrugineus TaxID=83449 RepID=A0A1L9B085_9BACT|nr:hypothetical protein [Cystobacter ferrugineus]OJH35573.1 hypothetical protein BON30_36470 [Cystobacter ferrugineus]
MLDTCTLQTVSMQSELREWFAQWLEAQDLTCYLAETTLVEVAGRNEQHVAERLKGLRALRKQVGSRLRGAASFNDTVRAQLQQRQPGPVEVPPGPSLFEWMTGFDDHQFPTVSARASFVADYVARLKDTLFETDRNLRAHVRALRRDLPEEEREISAEFVVSEIIGRRRLGAGDLMIDTAAERLLEGRMTPRQVEERLSQCPVLNCAAHLVWRANLANSAPPAEQLTPAQNNVIGLFRTKSAKKGGRGDWYDYHTAATAAACTMFITGDDDLFRRCSHIQHLGVSGINA